VCCDYVVYSANPENDQYRHPADPSCPSQLGPQAYLVLDVFSTKVSSTDNWQTRHVRFIT